MCTNTHHLLHCPGLLVRCAWKRQNGKWCMEEPSPEMAGPPFHTAIGDFVAFACLCL